MLKHFDPVLASCQPYLLATELIAGDLAREPFGVLVPDALCLNPQHRRNAGFLHLLKRLDELTFGPVGMPMPKWVFYDCAVMPGAVFGMCRPASQLEPWVRLSLDVPKDYDGPVPVSMFIAIPMLEGGRWLLYTLCDINEIAPGAAPEGLSELTMVLGIEVFRMRELMATAQWRSRKLVYGAQLGPLEVVTAWTPAHSIWRTITWRTTISEEGLRAVLSEPGTHPFNPLPTHMIDVDDESVLRRVQHEVEQGMRWLVVGPPVRRGAYTQVPMRRETADGVAAW